MEVCDGTKSEDTGDIGPSLEDGTESTNAGVICARLLTRTDCRNSWLIVVAFIMNNRQCAHDTR